MDWIDNVWPDDLSQVQWGPLSAWVGSLLTAGSLLLGFYILLRDRRKEEQAQARQVTTELSSSTAYPDTGPVDYAELQIHNGSTSAIFDVVLILTPLPAWKIRRHVPHFESVVSEVDRTQRTNDRAHVIDGKMAVLEEELPIKALLNITKARDKINPGKTKLLMIELAFDLTWYNAHMRFTDLAGNRWVRDVWQDTFRKAKRKRVKRRSRPGRFERSTKIVA